jgi:hypothetical protein
MSIEKATLKDGKTIDFVPDMIGEGGMKQVYFTPDKSSVVCFFKDTQDQNRIQRLDAVIGRLNPTTDPKNGAYWKDHYCWPTAIVTAPRLGVVCPTYPKQFLFGSGNWKGKEKKSRWFSSPKLRAMLPEVERGSWISYFALSMRLARSVRRLHQAGLAHADLSSNNVLIDPTSGQAIIIDIDSLVVRGIFPPDVLGTPNYIAPEVLSTVLLPLNDPQRKHPCIETDQHALAVLIYEYLLFRHPLKGPKPGKGTSGEEQERDEMGRSALYVEHPADRSNRPKDLLVEASALGPGLAALFQKTFVDGVQSPNKRVTAGDFERTLYQTWDSLMPCPNTKCPNKWVVFQDTNVRKCPFCGAKLTGSVPVLKFLSERKPGQWMADGSPLVVYDYRQGGGMGGLFKWHAFSGEPRSEGSDKTRLAYFVFHQGQWLMVNENLPGLTSPGGNPVPVGQAVALTNGVQFKLSPDPRGKMVEVQVITL